MYISPKFKSINNIETLTYLLVFLIVVSSLVFSYKSPLLFSRLIDEDGFVEWLTVIGLMLGMWICFKRVYDLFSFRSTLFLVMTFGLGLLFLFGAGEEISWGQRIFEVDSPQWFLENNKQNEINIHNLVIQGVKLNKLVFSTLLFIIIGIYFLLITPAYRYFDRFSVMIDQCAVPIPKTHQIIAFLVLALIIHLPHIPGRESELFEFGGAFLFVIILLFPYNRHIYVGESLARHHAPNG